MRAGAGIGVLVAAAVAATPAAAAAPKISQLVVFRNGDAVQSRVTASSATARVGSKRCAVGAATPLAALLRSKITGVQLKDYGSCSTRPADAGGLYVRRIRKDAARGVDGWVYKVGNKAGTTGAGDPSGPFGSGRLKRGALITWFYCRMKGSGCQRTLTVDPKALGGGQVKVTVRAFDDQGKTRPAAGAKVFLGAVTATADSRGVATVSTSPGTAGVHATAKGMVRSFEEQVAVK